MSVIDNIKINDHNIEIIVLPFERLVEKKSSFNGQKLHHPFKTNEIDDTYTYWDSKKRKNITKPCKELVYADEFLSEESKDDIQNASRIEMKHDGSCGFILYDEQSGKFVPYTRYDMKKDKDGNFKEIPKDAILCEEKPTDPSATHWPCFVPVLPDGDNKKQEYKWQQQAFELMTRSARFDNDKVKFSFTCEYMGKKINWKKSDPIDEDAVIVPHGLIEFNIPIELRNYEGFRKIFEKIDYIEGFIVHGKEHIWKIRREMFLDQSHGHESKKLKWPSSGERKLSDIVALK